MGRNDRHRQQAADGGITTGRVPLPFVYGIGIFLLALITWLDYMTGYELGFFIFYFVPVAVAAWLAGQGPGLVFACIAAVCWYWSDRATHHPYSRAYLIYWETFMRLVSFLTTAITLSRIRALVGAELRLKQAVRHQNHAQQREEPARRHA